LARGDLAAAEQTMREGAALGARPDDLRAIEAMIAACAGRDPKARQLVRELERARVSAAEAWRWPPGQPCGWGRTKSRRASWIASCCTTWRRSGRACNTICTRSSTARRSRRGDGTWR